MRESWRRTSMDPRKPYFLLLVQRLVEPCERGVNRGGGGAHGGKARLQYLHAASWGERGLGRAGAGKRVGGSERGGDELIECDALRLGEPHTALDLADRPAAQRGGEIFADGGPRISAG